MKWGNAKVTGKTEKDGVIELTAEVDVADQDFKKTKKLHWVTVDPSNFEVTLVELDHLITEKKVDENTKVQDVVNKNSYIAYTAIAEGPMSVLKKGAVIQLERRGYFMVDKEAGSGNKMTLHFIPDGKSKNMSVIESKLDAKTVAKGNTAAAPEKKVSKKA